MAARKRLPRSPIEKDPNRPLIERALAMGIPMTQVAKRYGYGLMAVSRFRDRMPQQRKAAIVGATLRPGIDDLEKLRSDEAVGLLGNLAHQRARLLLMQDVCMEEGGVDQVARLSGVIHKNLEMVGRYLGLLPTRCIRSSASFRGRCWSRRSKPLRRCRIQYSISCPRIPALPVRDFGD